MDGLNCLVSDSLRIAATGSGALSDRTFVVKDLFSIAGHVSSFGHPRWRTTHKPNGTTAPVVERLLGAGASMTGLAKLDQLAYSMIGNVGEGKAPINSLYPDCFTGGSSSGTASAVAGGVCDFGLGTDTGGSIRVPAAACGLFSIRPTHGLIDSIGALPLAPSFDVVGLLARDPLTLGEAFEVLLGRSPQDSPPIERLLLPTDCLDGLAPPVAEVIVGFASILGDRFGMSVEATTFARFTGTEVADLFTRLQGREIWATHGEWIRENHRFLAPDVVRRLKRAESLAGSSVKDVAADARARDEFRTEYERLTGAGTAILLPVMPGLPPRRDADAEELLRFRTESLRWLSPAGLTGSPEVVMPVVHGESELTYGIGILGAKGADLSLLALAGSTSGRTGLVTV
jgi:amidase